ncbi:MAG TPA: DUF4395 domain-containing protein [Sulfurovum sp.]|uniref:DUF4395 domain-containing protein n=1 Tax=Sulfurovum sp. TaxID=1969726 RepID=UPI002F948EF7
MAQVCPISTKRVDSNMIRAISFQVALFAMLFLLFQEVIFAWVLLFDFLMRMLRLSGLSPFHIVGTFAIAGSRLAPKLCDESPKRFALYLGLVTSLSIVIFYMADLTVFATALAILLLICALLETLFDFCIGCKIYYAIQIGKGFLNNGRNFQ